MVFVIAAFVAYQPVWRAGFIWDDDDHLTANPAMTAPDGLRRIWSSLVVSRYYPLTLTTFWVQRRLWGLNPLPYHLVNIGLHAVNAFLLFLALRRLRVPAAGLAAAVWLLHPVNVESVAWITELKNTQSGYFFFCALLFFLRFVNEGQRRWQALSLVCGAAAMLSKPSTVVLPLVLLLCIWWQRGRWRQTDIMWIAPFFAMALAMSILTIAEQLGHIAVQGEAEWTLGFAERLIIASNAIWFYAGKVLCPADLAFVYPRWNVVTSSIWSWFPLAGVIIVGGVLWAWRRRSWARVGLFGFLFFVMALLPVLGFFDVFYFRYSFVADHFQYLASLGIIALAATGIAQVLERNKLWLTPTGNVLCAVLLVTLAGLTWKQARVYRDPETLWRDTVTKNPVGWMAHDNLGYTLTQAGKLDEAMEHFERALRIRPDYPEAHNNLGVALTRAGRTQEAISHFEQALRLKPHYPDAYYNLGIALADAGRLQEAVVYYERALELKPDNAEAYNNLGNALVRIGRVEDAIRHWEQSLQINPDFAEAHNNWGSALLGMGKAQEAIEHYERSLRINPDYAKAHYNLGTALELTGRTQEAINHYERAAQLNPAFAEAQDALKRVRGSQ